MMHRRMTPTRGAGTPWWLRTAFVLVAAFGLLHLGQAGFNWGEDDDDRNYRGSDLSDAQKGAISDGIMALRTMAGNDPSARNRRTMLRVAECLAGMLEGGRICVESGKNTAKAALQAENPRRCTWRGDKMNIRAECIGTNEPTLSAMIAALMHEGIHAIQWPDGSGLAQNRTQREWVAHSWEVYILDRRLAEETLTQAQRDKITSRRNFLVWRRDALCDTSLTDEQRSERLKECSDHATSESSPDDTYSQAPDDSSVIHVGETTASYDIQTPYARTFDLEVGTDGSGDVLIVCGVDGSGTSGGVTMYYDNTGDGLADESTETLVGTLGKPISLGFAPDDGVLRSTLYVLDRATASVFISIGDVNGRPTTLEAVPFATIGSYPFLADAITLRSGGADLTTGRSVFVSDRGDEVDELDASVVDYKLTDQNLDGVANVAQARTWLESVRDYVPTILSDVQAGDQTIAVAGASLTLLRAHVTDADATFLGELLGQIQIFQPNHAREVLMPLNRPLDAGEFIVVADVTTNRREPAGTLVEVSRPEITATDRSTYFPGDLVVVSGRNFGLGSVVTVSGLEVDAQVLNPSTLFFFAPTSRTCPRTTSSSRSRTAGTCRTSPGSS
ncbi:MAG: hypothetical protein GY711_11240 [bacterium]|nr:hypothetical protein [bacterium]